MRKPGARAVTGCFSPGSAGKASADTGWPVPPLTNAGAGTGVGVGSGALVVGAAG